MTQEDLRNLSKKIERTYNKYIRGKATLVDILKFFNISIDETRIEDYEINDINFISLSIELIDKRDNTILKSNYDSSAKMLHYIGFIIKFIKTSSTNEERKIESLYCIGDGEPIITKISIVNGDYELVFEKERKHNEGARGSNSVKYALRYFKKMLHEEEIVQQQLLAKRFNFEIEDEEGFFEQTYTYSQRDNYILKETSQDKYAYINDNNVIFISKLDKEIFDDLAGICFENFSTNINLRNYLPFIIKNTDFPNLEENSIKSAIVFKHNRRGLENHKLQILKNDNNIKTKYYITPRIPKNSSTIDSPICEEFNLPIQVQGKINITEIDNIIKFLDLKYGGEFFIKYVVDELRNFSTKIKVRNNDILDDDPISPKIFVGKSLEEISDILVSNKEEYFKLMSNQFSDLINIPNAIENEPPKVLKKEF